MITVNKLPAYPIWHVESDNRWELAMTFLRMEEYYECPNPQFQGKIFSFEEYEDWYVREQSQKNENDGSFTYARDWSAFNVPGHAVRAVFNAFKNHSEKESRLFGELLSQGAFASEKFYVIGNRFGEQLHFAHEYRHALFALCTEYREAMSDIIRKFPVKKLRTWILQYYSVTVLEDEIQAYALTGWPQRMLPTKEMNLLKNCLQNVERKYIPAT